MRSNPILWAILFMLIFCLTMDFWSWSENIRLRALGLPSWLFYAIGVQVLFSIVLYLFSRYYWKEAVINTENEQPS